MKKGFRFVIKMNNVLTRSERKSINNSLVSQSLYSNQLTYIVGNTKYTEGS